MKGAKPGWGVAQQLASRLNKECMGRLWISVYSEYSPDTNVEAYHIIAKHPTTGEPRFRRLVTTNELLSEEGVELLMTQLYLVEPPT